MFSQYGVFLFDLHYQLFDSSSSASDVQTAKEEDFDHALLELVFNTSDSSKLKILNCLAATIFNIPKPSLSFSLFLVQKNII